MAAIWPYIECFSTILVACELLFCLPMLEPRLPKRAAILAVAAFLVVFNSRIISTVTKSGGSYAVRWLTSLNAIFVFAASVVLIYLVFSCTKRLALFYASAGYATENLIFYVRNADTYFPGLPWTGTSFLVFKVAGSLLVAYLVYVFLVKRYPRGHEPNISGSYTLAFVVTMLLVTNVLNTWVRVDDARGPQIALFAFLCNLMLLLIEFDVFKQTSMEQERQILESLMVERERQQRLSQENIELINIKCHDLKHQIAALRDMPAGAERDRVIGELEQTVMIYDSMARTGNPALDAVLTEKGLICESRSIDFTCMVDETCLAGINPVDIYTLFGNAIDNAIEASSRLDDPDGRMVSLLMERQGAFARICIVNTCEGTINIKDGLPETTKDDNRHHGFGLKSIQMIVERLGGNMVIESDDGSFTLSIIFPLSSQQC